MRFFSDSNPKGKKSSYQESLSQLSLFTNFHPFNFHPFMNQVEFYESGESSKYSRTVYGQEAGVLLQ